MKMMDNVDFNKDLELRFILKDFCFYDILMLIDFVVVYEMFYKYYRVWF